MSRKSLSDGLPLTAMNKDTNHDILNVETRLKIS